jgi:PIN domain nuclease of toxin-antitoxin system
VSDLLLDTCALLWIANGDEIDATARAAISAAKLHVSPISVWERSSQPSSAGLPARTKLQPASPERCGSSERGCRAVLSVDILAESCALPGTPPSDPADRIIIATARTHELAIVTRDRAILRYAEAGQVRALGC